MVANILLLLVIAQAPSSQPTPWEVWSTSVETRAKQSEQMDRQLKNEIDVLRSYLNALQATQDRQALVVNPVAVPDSMAAVPAKTADGHAIAPAHSVDEALQALYALQHAVEKVKAGDEGSTWHDYISDTGVMGAFGFLLTLVWRIGGRLKRMEPKVEAVASSPVVTGGIPSAPDANSLSSVPLPPA